MKNMWAALLVFFLFPSLLLANPLTNPPIYFAIDLDRTLVDQWKEGMDSDNLIEISYVFNRIDGDTLEQDKYRMIEGGGEFLQALSMIPNAKIAFFSAGIESRNLALLNQIKLPDGRSAASIAQAGIFSRQHLHPLSKKKDLTVVCGDHECLKNTILIDDQFASSAPQQEKNLLWLPNESASNPSHDTFVFHEVGTEILSQILLKKSPEILINQNRLVRAMGIIDVILEKMQANTKTATQVLHELQWKAPRSYKWNILEENHYIIRGYKWFRKVNPNYSATWRTSAMKLDKIGYLKKLNQFKFMLSFEKLESSLDQPSNSSRQP